MKIYQAEICLSIKMDGHPPRYLNLNHIGRGGLFCQQTNLFKSVAFRCKAKKKTNNNTVACLYLILVKVLDYYH